MLSEWGQGEVRGGGVGLAGESDGNDIAAKQSEVHASGMNVHRQAGQGRLAMMWWGDGVGEARGAA